MLVKSGIYKIENKKTGMFYIGSSINFSKRKTEHFNLLRRNLHPNTKLQNAWNHHGPEGFEFIILEELSEVTKDALLAAEQKWIDRFKPYEREVGYNLCPIASSRMGTKHSEETRRKIREQAIGRTLPKEVRDKMASSQRGRKHSEETKRKMSESAKVREAIKKHDKTNRL